MATAKCTLRPLGDRVVIRPLELPDKTPGGILLPDQAKEKPTRGVVLAVGPGRLLESGERHKIDVKVGDTVLYGRWDGSDVEHDGATIKILSEGHVLAVVD